jgi:CO/xanthine dehydrogenase FAD-binding subunit
MAVGLGRVTAPVVGGVRGGRRGGRRAVASAVLDATVHVQGRDGPRLIPLPDFFTLAGDGEDGHQRSTRFR